MKKSNFFFNVVRWIGVLPVALLVICLGYIVCYFVFKYSLAWVAVDTSQGVWAIIDEIWTKVVATGVSFYLGIRAGAFIAPNNKFIASVVLATILLIISLYAIYLWIMYYEIISMIIGVLSCIAGIIGLCVGCQSVKDEERRNIK